MKSIERKKKETKERENTINFLSKIQKDLTEVDKFHNIDKKYSKRQVLETLIKQTTNYKEKTIENTSKNIRKAVDTKMTEFYKDLKKKREEKNTIEFKEMDYLIRACREKEILLLKKKYNEENSSKIEEQKRMFKNYIQKNKRKSQNKKTVKRRCKDL